MGYSDRGPASATSRSGAAHDLHTLLDRAGIAPPYVLVGHSLGGIYAREFARRYPDDVAGLVFVDSTHEEIARSVSRQEYERALRQIKQLRYARFLMPFGVQRLLGLSISNAAELPKEQRPMAKGIGYRSSSYFALYDEMSSLLAENNSGTLKMQPIPGVPITVIASQKNLDDPEHGQVWHRLQAEFMKLSSDARYVEATGSGHFVQVDRPEIVIDAVRDVLSRAAARHSAHS